MRSVNLRGHHLLCMLTYVGYGYTPEFTRAFDRVMEHINAGGLVTIVSGPDDLCRTLDPATQPDYHCNNKSVTARDEAAMRAVSDLLDYQIHAGGTYQFDAQDFERLRAAFRAGTIRTACAGCEWHDVCTSIAHNQEDKIN